MAPLESIPPAGRAAAAATPTAEWAVTPEGADGIRIGESLDALLPRLAAEPDAAARAGECTYLPVRNAPEGMLFMFEGSELVRIDVVGGSTRTAEGAGIGDSEERIRALYPQIRRSPHKYTEGAYLIEVPAPPRDSMDRIIFETDGARVTRYRAGRLPPVAYVEGCG